MPSKAGCGQFVVTRIGQMPHLPSSYYDNFSYSFKTNCHFLPCDVAGLVLQRTHPWVSPILLL